MITVENLNVLFQDMKLMHVEFDQVMHYLFEIIPNNLNKKKKFKFLFKYFFFKKTNQVVFQL
jgi:hypothetical protein